MACTLPALAQFSVEANGAPTFTQAIAVPPGAGGLAPSLSIKYDASGNNAALGYGWSLRGISAITRCAATPATDGRPGTISNGPDDKLCLDGQRLIPIDAQGKGIVGFGTNDAAGTGTFREYRTEVDSYARIRAYGFANGDSSGASGPAYFRAWTKAGQIIDFGASPTADANTNALISVSGNPLALSWAVGRIADAVGNHIDFKYEQRDVAWGSGATSTSPTAGHEWNLLEVQYSGNKVIFNYDPQDQRADKAEAWQRGLKSVSARLLKSITTYVNSPNTGSLGPASGAMGATGAVATTTYRFDYETGGVSHRSRLKAIHECAGDATSTRCQPPTVLTYGDGGAASYAPNGSFDRASLTMQSATGNYGVIVGDFDGDGRADLIRWADDPTQNQLLLSNGDGTFTPSSAFNITNQNLFKSDGCYLSMVGDFNGDGLPDIFRYAGSTNAAGASCTNPGVTTLYLSNGDGSFTAKTVTGVAPGVRTSAKQVNCITNTGGCEPGDWVGWTSGWTYYLLDVDGDGKLDIVTANLPAQTPSATPTDPCASVVCTRVYLGDGQGNFTQLTTTNLANQDLYSNPDGFYTLGSPSHVADIDGDGLADLVAVGNPWIDGSITSWRSQGAGNFAVAPGIGGCRYPIDFNGDGRLDCLLANATPAYNRLQLSNGIDLSLQAGNFNLTGTGQEMAGTGVGIVVADFNGDGRHDILRWENDPTKNALYLSNGDGTYGAAPFTVSGASGSYALQNSDGTSGFVVADFTGHGNAEILRMQTLNGVVNNQLLVKQDSTPLDLLTSVTSGTGAVTTITQVPLGYPSAPANAGAPSGPRYVSDRGQSGVAAVYPSVDITPPNYVVATVTTDSGVGSNKLSTEYIYRGLKVDTKGRGSLGFREVIRQNVGADGSPLAIDTQFLQTHPYIGLVSKAVVYQGRADQTSSATALRTTTRVYCDQTITGGQDATTKQATVNAAISSGTSCASTAVIARPFLLYTSQSGQDLDGSAVPNGSSQFDVGPTGDPTDITWIVAGTAAGVSQSVKKTLHNDYLADDISCNADNFTCRWFIGRVSQSTVASSVPNSLPSIPTSAGSSPTATAINGSGSMQGGVMGDLKFGTVTVGASTTLTTTIANNGGWNLSLTPPGASAVSGSDFSFVSTDCPTSLAPSATCHVTVQFAPVGAGARSGTLTVSTGSGPLTAALSGTGAAPAVAIFPGWTSWGSVGAASDSGDWLTVKNNSTVSVLLTAHAPATNPTGTMWSWGGTSGNCIFGTTVLAPGASCATFFGIGAGATTGAYTAVDQVSYRAQNVSATTFTVQQSYNFSIADTTLNSASLSFGNVGYGSSGSNTVTLTNGADAPLDNLSLSISGASASSYSASSSCGTSVPAHGTCTLTITFAPQAVANGLAAQLLATGSYSRYAATGKQNYYPYSRQFTVTMSGNGYGSVATRTSASTLTVPAAWYGGTGPQTVVAQYTNNGNAPMTLATPTLAAPLSASSNCSSIAPGGSCSITVTETSNVGGINQSQTFTPTGATVAPAATTVTWTTYTAVPRWNPTSLSFGSVTAGSSSSQNITLTNDGNTTFNWASNNGIANAPTSFSFNTSACTSVAPGGSCNVVVTFAPTGVVSYNSGGITMSAASYSTNTFSVNANGISQPSISASASSISGTAVSPNAATASVSFTNNGQTPTTLTLSVNGGLSVSPSVLNCPANSGCGSVTVSSPSGMGSYAGTLSMTSSAGGSVTTVSASLQVTGSVATLTSPSPSITVNTVSQGSGGASGAWTFRNDGTSAMTLSPGALNSPFSWTSNTCSGVAPGGYCGLYFRMAATNVGTFSQSGISVSGATQGNRSDLSVQGTVQASNTTISVSPNPLAFGTVAKSIASDRTLTITNTGSVPTTLNAPGIVYTSGSSTVGTYYLGSCSGTIPAGGQCTMAITYSAGCAGGPRNATVTINGTNFPAVSVPVTASTSTSGSCI